MRAASFDRRIFKIENHLDIHGREGRGHSRHLFQLHAQARIGLEPDLAVIKAEDCDDAEFLRELNETRAWARGDFEEAERLQALAPRLPDSGDPDLDIRDLLHNPTGGEARRRAFENAANRARKRLGLIEFDHEAATSVPPATPPPPARPPAPATRTKRSASVRASP